MGFALTAVLVVVLPFLGAGGPSLASILGLTSPAYAAPALSAHPLATVINSTGVEVPQAIPVATVFSQRDAELASTMATARNAWAAVDVEHLAQKPVPKPLPPVSAAGAASGTNDRRAAYAAAGRGCPGAIGGGAGGAPGAVSALGVQGTTSDDIASFAATYNSIRVANCLEPIPFGNFRYDSCMEQRLFWMAEDPSEDPMSAWGHMGSVRSDGLPSVGCDGNLAGGSGNSGSTVASKWWDSGSHRASLYKPNYSGGVGGVCIYFAMTHGGVPNEPYGFTRAAAAWGGC